MNWTKFETHGQGYEQAFEDLCCRLFELYGKNELEITGASRYRRIGGAGGDGGIEAIWRVEGADYAAVQAKWFPTSMGDSQIRQIKKSVDTALEIRPEISKLVVCIPHNLNSKRNGVKTSEEARWEGLCLGIQKAHPGLELILWDDAKITQLLQEPSSEGVGSYWFRGHTIRTDCFRMSYRRQKESWIRERYAPDLHACGHFQKLLRIQQSPEAMRKQISNKLLDWAKKLTELRDDIDFFALLDNKIEEDTLQCARRAIKEIEEAIPVLYEYSEALALECVPPSRSAINFAFERLRELSAKAGSIRYGEKAYYTASHLSRTIDSAIPYGWSLTLNEADQLLINKRLIVLGNPGVGKTHALCHETEELLKSGRHNVVLIRASSVNPSLGWGSIIASSLHLATPDSDASLFGALECSAARLDECENERSFYVRGKVLIYVDGLDESRNTKQWIELIKESSIVSEIYPRIRFCFSSRPHVFQGVTDPSLKADIVRLPHDGDVPMEQIFDAYVGHYNINIHSGSPVRQLIRTPLALRLFCIEHSGQTISTIDPSSCTITNLIASHLKSLESESLERMEGQPRSIQPTSRILNRCSKLFLSNEEVTFSALLADDELSRYLDSNTLGRALEGLVSYGVLCSREAKGEGLFAPAEIVYTTGMQPFFDYALALEFVSNQVDISTAEIPTALKDNHDALKYAAISALEDKGVFLFENTRFSATIENISDPLEFACETLASVSPLAAETRLDTVRAWISKGSTELIGVTNNLICNVAGIEGHPLGPPLLDEYLKSFETPATRDERWSLPDYLEISEKQATRVHIGQIWSEHLRLGESDTPEGKPLVLAWHLSTLDSLRREDCERSLSIWATKNPIGFVRLFGRMKDVDDPQVVESMYGIAASLSLSNSCPSQALIDMASMAISQLFSTAPVFNASLRNHGRILAERALSLGLIDQAEADKARPPYETSADALPLSKEGLSGDTNHGPGPLHYDLSRYVLCDPIARKFFPHFCREDNAMEKAQAFLLKQAETLEANTISSAQFCHAATYSYLLDHGWDPEIHDYFERDGDGRVSCGIDTAITSAFYPGDHGNRSRVMSIGEKYVWCAKNEILGFLADRLPFHDASDSPKMLEDYSLLDSFRMPCAASIPHQETESPLPCGFALQKECVDISETGFSRWVHDAPLPDLSRHVSCQIFEKTEYPFDPIALYSHFYSEKWGLDELVVLTACAIASDQADNLIATAANENSELHNELKNQDHIRSFMEYDCYMSPQEICASTWKDETDSSIKDSDSKLALHPSYLQCCINSDATGDKYYQLPSRLFRDLLEISCGDGLSYTDNNGNIVSVLKESGELGDNVIRICLAADKHILENRLKERGLQLIWIAHVDKRVNLSGRELFDDLHAGHDWYLIARNTEEGFKCEVFAEETWPVPDSEKQENPYMNESPPDYAASVIGENSSGNLPTVPITIFVDNLPDDD